MWKCFLHSLLVWVGSPRPLAWGMGCERGHITQTRTLEDWVFSSRRVGLIQASEHQSGNLLEPLRKSYSLLCGPCGQELSYCCWWQRLGTSCLRWRQQKKKSCRECETYPWWLSQSTWVLSHHFHIFSWSFQFSSVQFSHTVVSNSLRLHELQHTRPPCPSPTPRVYSNSCPLSRWCHPAISSSVFPSPPAPNPSQNQGLFQWVNSSHEVAKVLEFQL